MQQANRTLTYDEKKAAEAAFNGLPFNPKWSEAAHIVYVGISTAMGNRKNEVLPEELPSETTSVTMQTVG